MTKVSLRSNHRGASSSSFNLSDGSSTSKRRCRLATTLIVLVVIGFGAFALRGSSSDLEGSLFAIQFSTDSDDDSYQEETEDNLNSNDDVSQDLAADAGGGGGGAVVEEELELSSKREPKKNARRKQFEQPPKKNLKKQQRRQKETEQHKEHKKTQQDHDHEENKQHIQYYNRNQQQQQQRQRPQQRKQKQKQKPQKEDASSPPPLPPRPIESESPPPPPPLIVNSEAQEEEVLRNGEEQPDNNFKNHNNPHHNSSSSVNLKQQHKIHYVNEKDVTQRDSFSASWLQSKADFLDMDLTPIGICEDAAFKAWNTRRHKLRMTLDYLDFSVEHLSKWWKNLAYHEEPIIYNSIMDKLHKYITLAAAATNTPQTPTPTPDPNSSLLLGETVVTIAFQPYGVPRSKYYIRKGISEPGERAHNLTVVSLAATIESLRRAEMGRIVVVGSEDEHEQTARDAFQYLHQHLPHLPYIDKGSSDQQQQIGHLELGFVKITENFYKTKSISRNMPRGSLVGAKKAFQLADTQQQRQRQLTTEEEKFLKQWFGTKQKPTYWKYLYLTEPDTLLVTRKVALQQIKDEIDHGGGIVSPWRLQPMMHESDMMGYPHRNRFLQIRDGFEEVIELDHTGTTTGGTAGATNSHYDVCCDENPQSPDFRPGENKFPKCSGKKKWFMCGFESQTQTDFSSKDRHERLRPYQFIRLTKGSNLTLVAGNLFGRRCFPGSAAKNSQSSQQQCNPYPPASVILKDEATGTTNIGSGSSSINAAAVSSNHDGDQKGQTEGGRKKRKRRRKKTNEREKG